MVYNTKKEKRVIMKNIILILALALLSSGCSKTWTGIKQDTHEMLSNTKEVVHEATAPDTVPDTSVENTMPVAADTHVSQPVEPVIPSMTN